MVFWFVAAALVLIAELFVGTVFLLVISAALFGAGLAVFFSASHTVGILTAAVLAAAGIWWVHGWLKRRRSGGEAPPDDLDIGQTVRIGRHLHGNVYEVHYRGTIWQAQAENGAPQTSTAEITGKNGNLLIIRFI